MSKLIVLRGYPGSGKTTIGKELEKNGVGLFIDHNAILTLIANIAGNDDGLYDEIIVLEKAICKKLLSENKIVIVARGFSKVSSIDEYTHLAIDLGVEYQVIRLEVNESELMIRVQSPERKNDFNPTDNEIAERAWISDNPLENYKGEIVINNQRPLSDVVLHISDHI